MSEVPRNVLVTRERCAMCGEISRVGFWVPNDVWEAAVHTYRQNDLLCLRCFTVGADEKLIAWDEQIQLYPVSFVTHLQAALASEESPTTQPPSSESGMEPREFKEDE